MGPRYQGNETNSVKKKTTEPPGPETIKFYKAQIIRFSWQGPRLTPKSTCGELAEKLMAVCRGKPEFLRPESCRRYLGLLPEFKSFGAHFGFSENEVSVANQPIRRIPQVLSQWVSSYLYDKTERHPILPSYALDTATFAESMLRDVHMGRYRYPENHGLTIEIEPLVEGCEEIRFQFTSRDKSEFTRASRLELLVAKVPPGGQVKFNYTDNNEVLLGEGSEFEFRTQRCYLSENWGGNAAATLACEEPYRLDVQSDFKFPGDLHIPPDHYPPTIEVPAHWVIASADHKGNRLPVPFGELSTILEKP
jgi:hypothetical protein